MHEWTALLVDRSTWPVTRHTTVAEVATLLGSDGARSRRKELLTVVWSFGGADWVFWWRDGLLDLFEVYRYYDQELSAELPFWFDRMSRIDVDLDAVIGTGAFYLKEAWDGPENGLFESTPEGTCQIEFRDNLPSEILFVPDRDENEAPRG